MSKDRRIYICCVEDRKPYLMAKAKSIFGREAVSEELEAATLVFVVGESSEQMEEEVIEAENSGIPVKKVNENFIEESIYEKLLSQKSQMKIRSEKKLGHEWER